MITQRLAMIFGVVFIAVGLLGFVPGVTLFAPDADNGYLFGVFAVDPLHNEVHLLSGFAAIAAGWISERASRIYFRVLGIGYGLLALLGFYFGKMPILGLMAHNMPDMVLHAAVAIVALVLGFAHLFDRFEHHGGSHHHPA
jgi:hypothetical protein